MTKARANPNAIRLPGKERPASSRLVIQMPPTTEPHHRNTGRNTKPSAGHPSGKQQRVSITDSFGASPVSSALDHSAGRDPGRVSNNLTRSLRLRTPMDGLVSDTIYGRVQTAWETTSLLQEIGCEFPMTSSGPRAPPEQSQNRRTPLPPFPGHGTENSPSRRKAYSEQIPFTGSGSTNLNTTQTAMAHIEAGRSGKAH
jgi:hypothetical protein